MRCPDCNKFAQYDEPEVEVSDSSIDDNGLVTVDGEMMLRSACCNSDLKSWSFSLEGDVDVEGHVGGKHSLSVECDDANASDYYDNPGRPSRYRRHIYTVEASAKVTCDCGGLDAVVDLKDEERASGFDELV